MDYRIPSRELSLAFGTLLRFCLLPLSFQLSQSRPLCAPSRYLHIRLILEFRIMGSEAGPEWQGARRLELTAGTSL